MDPVPRLSLKAQPDIPEGRADAFFPVVRDDYVFLPEPRPDRPDSFPDSAGQFRTVPGQSGQPFRTANRTASDMNRTDRTAGGARMSKFNRTGRTGRTAPDSAGQRRTAPDITGQLRTVMDSAGPKQHFQALRLSNLIGNTPIIIL